MKQWPVALQVYSVREDAAKDFAGTMRAVKEMGYDGVELAGTYGLAIPEVKEILDQVGLQLVSAHVTVDQLENDAILDAYAATGMGYIAIPRFTDPKTNAELQANITRFRAIAQRCKIRGLQLLYHNHASELKKFDDAYVLDTYYASISEDLLKTELDVCWIHVAGETPAPFVRKYTGRSPILHLKDFSGHSPTGKEEKREAPASTFEFRPVGYGLLDIPTILAAAEDAGCEWLVVEQDQPSMGKTPMECAAMSVRYLKTLL